ncbi:MAG: helix-turn-helix domain-containing protein [Variovorax sp.]|nr:helix-turn-helix domain-containing protein [Variovorax sp.]
MRTQPLLVVPFSEVRHFKPDDALHFEAIRVRASQHHWTIPAHRHEGLHQFQLLTEGAMVGVLDGERHALRAPAAVMVAPGVVHSFVYDVDSTGVQVTVPSDALASLSAHAPEIAARLQGNLVLDLSALPADAADCAQRFAMLGDEFNARRAGRAEALQSHVTLLALWFLRHAEATTGSGRRQALRDTLVRRYRTLVELHFTEHQPLAFYAEALGVTPDHLSRVCRAVGSVSALDLLHERVALEAKRVLAHTGATVAEVAAQLGFEDVGYFSRFFKKVTGMAPSAYREGVERGIAAVPRGVGGRGS